MHMILIDKMVIINQWRDYTNMWVNVFKKHWRILIALFFITNHYFYNKPYYAMGSLAFCFLWLGMMLPWNSGLGLDKGTLLRIPMCSLTVLLTWGSITVGEWNPQRDSGGGTGHLWLEDTHRSTHHTVALDALFLLY